MALPGKLERFIGKLTTQTEVEGRLLPEAVERLNNTLRSLRKVGGDGIKSSYEDLIGCVLKEGSADCFDRFEESVEAALFATLGRDLTDAEEALVGALVNEIEEITEALLIVGGVELTDTEGESGDEDDD